MDTKVEHQFSDGSYWEIIIIKQIHKFGTIILFEQRRFGLGCPRLYQVKWLDKFDLIKPGATPTERLLFKQYDAGECVDLLDEVEPSSAAESASFSMNFDVHSALFWLKNVHGLEAKQRLILHCGSWSTQSVSHHLYCDFA